jgi:hypothetical protein
LRALNDAPSPTLEQDSALNLTQTGATLEAVPRASQLTRQVVLIACVLAAGILGAALVLAYVRFGRGRLADETFAAASQAPAAAATAPAIDSSTPIVAVDALPRADALSDGGADAAARTSKTNVRHSTVRRTIPKSQTSTPKRRTTGAVARDPGF